MFESVQSKSLREQIRWIGWVASSAAGLTVFASIAGGVGDHLAGSFIRLILGYQQFLQWFWSQVSEHVSVDFSGFENELSLSLLLLSPFLVGFRRINRGGVFTGDNKLLAGLNLASISVLTTAFPSQHDDIWSIVLSLAAFLGCVLIFATYSLIEDASYRRKTRLFILLFSTVTFVVSIYYLFDAFDASHFSERIGLGIFAICLATFAYFVGVIFQIQNYYPFLFCTTWFVIFWCMNYFLLNIAPTIDQFLISIGA